MPTHTATEAGAPARPISDPASVHGIGLDEIDALLPGFRSRTVFHTSAWLRLLVEAYRLKGHVLTLRSGSDVLAVWPVLSLRKGLFRVVGSPLPGWCTAYLGPLFADGVDVRASCERMLREPEFRRASYLETRVVDPERRVPMDAFGLKRLCEFETFLLDLRQSEEELWDGCESRCRNAVRKAQKTGIEVRVEADDGWIQDFCAMSDEVFARWDQRPPYDLAFMKAMWRHLAPGRMRVLSSFSGGERAASVVMLHDDQTMYYWAGACFDRFRQANPNNLLLWESIRAAKSLALSSFDFVSSSGSAGKFKASFGPKAVVQALQWGRSRTAFEGYLKDLYERYARWRRARN